MDETMQLMKHWTDFKNSKPSASIDDFCQHRVETIKRSDDSVKNFNGLVPPQVDAFLIKLLGRIVQCYGVYATAALSEVSGLKQVEDFYFLNSITQLREVRKKDVISMMLFETSSGMDIINRLRDNGLIEERISTTDKRVRLLTPTAKGETVLDQCYQKLTVVNDMIWNAMNHNDKLLCINLLKAVEIRNSALATKLKGQSFQEMVKVVLGVTVGSNSI